MDIQTIFDTLNGAISPVKDLVLSRDLWEPLGDLMDYLQIYLIQVNNASIEKTDTEITLTGATSFLSVQQMECTLTVQLNGDQPALNLQTRLPSDWNFQHSFPEIPPSYKPIEPGSGLLVQSPTLLYDLSFHPAYLIVRNFESADRPYLKQGLNFSGTPKDYALFNPIDPFFPVSGSPVLEGSITLNPHRFPFMALYLLTDSKDIKFGALTINEVYKRLVITEPPFAREEVSRLEGTGHIVLGKNNPMKLHVGAPLSGSPTILTFFGKSDDDSFSIENGLSTLAEFAGMKASDLSLPDSLQDVGDIFLEDIVLRLNTEEKSVDYFSATIASSKVWEIIPQKLTAGELKLSWMVFSPFDSNTRDISGRIVGTIQLPSAGNARIDIEARNDLGFTLRGQLRQGDNISLTEALQAIVGNVSGLPDSLSITRLFLEASPKSKKYAFDIGLEGDWDIAPGDLQLVMKRITASTMYQGGENATTSGSFSGQMEIGKVDLLMTADFPGGDEGWTFKGMTYPDDQIPLEDLVAEAITLLGASQPVDIPEIHIRDLNMTYRTKDQFFEFAGKSNTKSTLPIGNINFELDTEVQFRSVKDATTKNRSFEATLLAQLEINEGNVFLLSYDMNSDHKVITGAWSAGNKGSLKINDILSLVGLSSIELPKEINPGLKSISISFDVATKDFKLMASSDSFGKVFFMSVVNPKTSARTWIFGVEFPTGWKLSDIPGIGKDLKSTDFLTFEEIAFVASSGDVSNVTLPALPTLGGAEAETKGIFLTDQAMTLSQGFNVAAIIDLESTDNLSVKNLQSATGLARLTVQAAIGKNNLYLRAGLQGEIGFNVGDDTLNFQDPYVRLDMLPALGVQLGGTLELEMSDLVLLASGGLIISVTEASARLMVEGRDPESNAGANLLGPLGIKGIQLNSIGMIVGATFVPPGVKFGFQAGFAIGQQPPSANDLAMVLQVIPAVPTPVVNLQLLSFDLAEIDIQTALIVFTNGSSPNLPQTLQELRATDVGFFYCSALTNMPDGSVASPGFGFHGNLDLFGFKARAALKIDPFAGISGGMQLSPILIKIGQQEIISVRGKGQQIIQIYEKKNNTWVKVVNADKMLPDSENGQAAETKTEVIMDAGGPVFEFSSQGPKFLFASIEVDFLDIVGMKVEAEVSTSGMRFLLQYYVSDILNIDLSTTLTLSGENAGFSAHASFHLDLDLNIDIPPIGDLDVGSIHLDSELSASLDLQINGQAFTLKIDGDFEFEGARLDLPQLTINIPLSSLKDLPETIFQHIKDSAGEIFADIFGGLKKLWEDAEKEMKEIYEDVEKFVEDVGKETEKIVGELADGAEKAVEKAAELAEDLENEIEDVGKKAVETAEAAGKEVIKLGKEAIETAEKLADEAEAIYNDAKKVAKEVIEDAEVFVKNVEKEIEKIGADAIKEAKEIAAAAEKEVKKILDDAEKVAEKTLEEAKKVAKEIEKVAKDFEKKAAQLWNEIEDLLKDVGKGIEKGAKEVGKGIEKGAKEVGKGIEKGAKEVVDFVSGY